jgi:hypothetical protein
LPVLPRSSKTARFLERASRLVHSVPRPFRSEETDPTFPGRNARGLPSATRSCRPTRKEITSRSPISIRTRPGRCDDSFTLLAHGANPIENLAGLSEAVAEPDLTGVKDRASRGHQRPGRASRVVPKRTRRPIASSTTSQSEPDRL